MPPLTLIFIVMLVASLATRLWLANRQIAAVRLHRDRVPAPFDARITLDAHRKAADYTIAKTRVGRVHAVIEALLLLAFTLGGGLESLVRFWSTHLASSLAQGTALLASVAVIVALVDLPFSLYRKFVIDGAFGFNRMTARIYAIDLVKQSALAAVFGLPLIAAILWLMDSMGPRWWLYVWLVWMGFNLLVLAIFPTFIAPLFNKFAPLENAELAQRIDRLLKRCGFKAQGLFVMDGSKRSSHGNAYFTGFGKSKRIVFFDTLLARLNGDEIEAVLAHELGHFKRRHILKRIVLLFAMSFFGLWLLGWLTTQTWFFVDLGVSTPGTATALALFMLVSPVFLFFVSPLSSLYSRKHEFEADAYAAEQSSAQALIDGLTKMYADNAATLTPDPLHSAFYDSHPPAAIRVARLRTLLHGAVRPAFNGGLP